MTGIVCGNGGRIHLAIPFKPESVAQSAGEQVPCPLLWRSGFCAAYSHPRANTQISRAGWACWGRL